MDQDLLSEDVKEASLWMLGAHFITVHTPCHTSLLIAPSYLSVILQEDFRHMYKPILNKSTRPPEYLFFQETRISLIFFAEYIWSGFVTEKASEPEEFTQKCERHVWNPVYFQPFFEGVPRHLDVPLEDVGSFRKRLVISAW